MRTGLLIAMRSEVPSMFACPEPGHIDTCQTGESDVGILVCGVGRERARAGARRLCDWFRPDLLLSLGFCGSVCDDLAVGDLVVFESVAHGRDVIPLARLPHEFPGLALHHGALLTRDRVVLSRSGIAHRYAAVDMESHAVAEVARELCIPLLVVRSVSDIVPARATPRSVAQWATRMRANMQIAAARLNEFAGAYFVRTGEE